MLKIYWRNFQLAHGKDPEDVEAHLPRFDVEYFPLTIDKNRSVLEVLVSGLLNFYGSLTCRQDFTVLNSLNKPIIQVEMMLSKRLSESLNNIRYYNEIHF